jgi:hypothetical protein
VSMHNANDQRKMMKNAAKDADEANKKALAETKASMDLASSQAQESLLKKRRAIAASDTIFTNPLGSQDQAITARKTLLGG